MLNEIFETIYIKSRWAFFFIHFFSILGMFCLFALITSAPVNGPLALSFSVFTSVISGLFIANKINDSKQR